jgi:DNA-binding response OmpR family regulator
MGRLFQAFSQIDSSLARKFEGTGLGLAMVKQMAELLGGTVAVASQEGEGARFTAWLPLRTLRAADASGSQSHQPDPADVAARVALVIEDDEGSADLVRLLLEAEGFAVLHASTAEIGLATAAEQPLDLITLDVRLPGIDGWECLARLRADTRLAHVPVVIISGMGDSETAMALGASAILQKPISRAELQVSLANLGLHEALDRTRTVLVVDDDPKAVELIAALLPAPAYAIVRAYGGSEAIILAQRLRPDLILLDLMMTHVNGFDVVEALQRHSETARIPILVVTAKDISAEDRNLLNASDKVIRIIEKAGFNRQGFMAEVRRALPPR